MPARHLPLVNNEIYHLVNRGTGAIPVFKGTYDYQRFILTFQYYQHEKPPFQFSKFLSLPRRDREKTFLKLKALNNCLVEIISYCLMPTHYHFLLKQKKDDGILNFIRLTTNSYAKYFNVKYKRKGGLFEGRFKAIRVETDEQLLHLSRYIHLNPYSSLLVKDIKSLLLYPYSSLSEYLGWKKTNCCQKEIVLSHFNNLKDYQDFITNQADYQRNLEIIKHQLLDY